MNENATGFVCTDGQYYAPNHRYVKERRAALSDRDSGTPPELERSVGDGALGKVSVQAKPGGRFLIVVTAIRNRLLDEDNMCEKFHVDLLRYSGVIPQDSPGKAKIEVRQRKADPGEEERVIIEVFRLVEIEYL